MMSPPLICCCATRTVAAPTRIPTRTPVVVFITISSNRSPGFRPHVANANRVGTRGVERIEWIAAGDQPQARAGRTVAERAAERSALQRRAAPHVRGQIGIRQGDAAEADEIAEAFSDVVLRDVRQPLLQVAVGGSDERQLRKVALQDGG